MYDSALAAGLALGRALHLLERLQRRAREVNFHDAEGLTDKLTAHRLARPIAIVQEPLLVRGSGGARGPKRARPAVLEQPHASPLLPLRRRLARHHLGGLKVHCGWLRRLSEYLWLLLLALERRLALRISFVALLFRLLLFLLLDEPRSDLVAEPLQLAANSSIIRRIEELTNRPAAIDLVE